MRISNLVQFGLQPSGADDSSGTSMSYTPSSLAGLGTVGQPAAAGGTAKASRDAFKAAVISQVQTLADAWCTVSQATNTAHGESLPTTPAAWVTEAYKAIATLVPPSVATAQAASPAQLSSAVPANYRDELRAFFEAPPPCPAAALTPRPQHVPSCVANTDKASHMAAVCRYLAACKASTPTSALLVLAAKPYDRGATEVALHNSLGVQASMSIFLGGFRKTVGWVPAGADSLDVNWWYRAAASGLWMFNRVPIKPPYSPVEQAFLDSVYWPALVELSRSATVVMWIGSENEVKPLKEVLSSPHCAKVVQPVADSGAWSPSLAAACVAREGLWDRIESHNQSESENSQPRPQYGI